MSLYDSAANDTDLTDSSRWAFRSYPVEWVEIGTKRRDEGVKVKIEIELDEEQRKNIATIGYSKGERASREEARMWAQDMMTDALAKTSAHAMDIRTKARDREDG